MPARAKDGRPHVVIIGGGFGGLTLAKSLANTNIDITLVDRTNHHLFQPLLYQVATAGLSPAEIASPIRSVVATQANVRVLLDEVTSIDLPGKRVLFRDSELRFDYLIVATGAETSYFDHSEWERFAPGLKTIDDAVEIRQRVLLAFETAERTSDEQERRRLLTFAVIGGGPTGVELAGALAELAQRVLAKDFRVIDVRSTRVVLIEAGPRILSSFSTDLSQSAVEQLTELNVEVITGKRVTSMDPTGVHIEGVLLPCSVVLWAAGVRATSLLRTMHTPLDPIGRVLVEPDLTVPGHNHAFVIGDAAAFMHQTGAALPGVSPVAMQQARCVARSLERALQGEPHEVFRYFDKGSMATIGRSRAIAQTGRMHLTGFVAWLAWLLVHIWYLIGFRNRFVVIFNWFYSYVAYRRGARLITGYGFHEHTRPSAIAPTEAVIPSRRISSKDRIA